MTAADPKPNPGRPVGRMTAVASAMEESPGSTEIRCRITSGEGNLRESATENKPPGFIPARVKRCGKSAPRDRQRKRHGKPHQEQNQIGVARIFGCKAVSGLPPGLVARSVRQRPLQMNGHPTRRNACGQNPAYRPAGTGFSAIFLVQDGSQLKRIVKCREGMLASH